MSPTYRPYLPKGQSGKERFIWTTRATPEARAWPSPTAFAGKSYRLRNRALEDSKPTTPVEAPNGAKQASAEGAPTDAKQATPEEGAHGAKQATSEGAPIGKKQPKTG